MPLSIKLCGDLKVIALLTGLQQGYTKYMCFLCEWEKGNCTTCGKNELEYPSPSSGQGWKNPATTPSHQTRFDEELCGTYEFGLRCSFLIPACLKNPLDSVKLILKRGSLSVLRFKSSSKMTGSTTCSRVMRGKHGMLFEYCAQSFSGMLGQNTIRN